jgi:hypothetical protein
MGKFPEASADKTKGGHRHDWKWKLEGAKYRSSYEIP